MEERSDDSDAAGDSVDSDDADHGRILGTTTVSQGGRISLVADVRDVFADRGVEVEQGDLIVYKLYDGRVVVEPA
jgi:hypothetical protein